MKLYPLLLFILVILPSVVFSQNEKKDSGRVIVYDINMSVEKIATPFIVKSTFKTLQEWLVNICKQAKPPQQIDTYKIEYASDENGNYIVSLAGVNTHDSTYKNQFYSMERIVFKPNNMFFNLPRRTFKKLNKKEVEEKLTMQLKEFTNSQVFRHSFLIESNQIVTGYNGEVIWCK